MNEWMRIDPLMPLPTGEVLCVDAEGKMMLGELDRMTLTRIICIGTKEELPQPTHYMIPSNPNK